MTHLLWQLFVLTSVVVGLAAAYSLAMRLVRTVIAFIDEGVDVLVALLFFLVIVPPLWLWEKGRRPMWRTLTKEQTRDLEAWLRGGAGR